MKLKFIEGQDVKAGDPIAQIDPRLYQAALDQGIAKKAQDEALLANARLDLDRYTKLVANNSVTKQQADTQRATVAQDEAQVNLDAASIDSSRTTLGYTNITSPISGRLGLRNVDEGNLIHATDTTGIVTVSQIQPISVIFNVPQQQLPRINTAKSQGNLSVDAMDNEDKNPIDHGTLEVIDNTIDQTTGTVRLKAVFPNPKLELWPGGFVDVRLLVETLKQAVVIPVAALQRGPKGPFVYVVVDDKATIRYVTPGQQDDKQAVVTAGLKADETIVTTGFSKLTEGSKVTAATDESANPGGPAALHQGTGLPPPRDTSAARGERRQHRDGNPPQNPPQGANAQGTSATQ
jgi:multidrug efflux system membrane fusion protein